MIMLSLTLPSMPWSRRALKLVCAGSERKRSSNISCLRSFTTTLKSSDAEERWARSLQAKPGRKTSSKPAGGLSDQPKRPAVITGQWCRLGADERARLQTHGPGANSSATRSTDYDSEADGDSHSSSSHPKTNPDPDDHPSLSTGLVVTGPPILLGAVPRLIQDSDCRVGLLTSPAAGSSPSHRHLRRRHPLMLTLCHELMRCVLGGAFAVTLVLQLLQLARAPADAGRCLLWHAGWCLLCDGGGCLLCHAGRASSVTLGRCCFGGCSERRLSWCWLGHCFSWRVVEHLLGQL